MEKSRVILVELINLNSSTFDNDILSTTPRDLKYFFLKKYKSCINKIGLILFFTSTF